MAETSRNREAVTTEAADWLARLDSSPDDASLRAAFEVWRAEAPAHAIAIARLTSAWELTEQLGTSAARSRGRRRAPASSGANRWFRQGMAAGLVLAVVAGAALSIQPGVSYATAVGKSRTIDLGHGAHLVLNTDTRIRLIHGRAGFEVRVERGEVVVTAPPGSEPIRMVSQGFSLPVQNVGLDMRLTGQSVDVAVLQGAVRLPTRDSHGVSAQAGELATLVKGDATTRIERVPGEINRRLAWREGRLEFNGQTLGEVVVEFNRYNREQLVASPSTADLRIGGAFAIDKPTEFAEGISKAFNLELRQNGADLEFSR